MTRSHTRDTIVQFHPLQHLVTDWLEVEHRRHMMYALLEVDVTNARRAIRDYRARTRTPLSLTAFLVYCLARAVDEDKAMQACRLGRRRLVLFADVDVGIMVEQEVDGVRMPSGHIIRAANRKGLGEIELGIRLAKEEQWTRSFPPWLQPVASRALPVWLALPGVLRRLIWTWSLRNPYRRKRAIGTVGVTAMSMFGHGTGWGIAPMAHPLTLVVGGLAHKPGLVGADIVEREYLCLTLTIDHDVIDGAPAARFAERLKELIEGGTGLGDYDREPAGLEETR